MARLHVFKKEQIQAKASWPGVKNCATNGVGFGVI